MASQSFTPETTRTASSVRRVFEWLPGNRPQINASLLPTGSSDAFLARVDLNGTGGGADRGEVDLYTAPDRQTLFEVLPGPDLSVQWETNGTLSISGRGLNLEVDAPDSMDPDEPYYWLPANSVDVEGFVDDVAALSPAAQGSDFTIVLDDGAGMEHAVDADPVAVTFAVPAAAVTHTAAPDIAIADFDQAGLRPPIVLAVFLADISGNYLTGSSNDVDPIEGEIDVSGTLTFGRIERRAGNVFRLYRDSGSTGRADTYFDTPGSPTYPTAKMYIQTAAGGRAEYDSANSGNNANFDLAAGEDAAVASGISTGDYFLIAIAEPTVEHAVNADPTTVAYAVPAAAITHTPRTLVAYAVDADPVTVAYAVPQPGVTHQGRIAVDHTVNAGAVTVAYAVPAAERLAHGSRLLPRCRRRRRHRRLRGPATHRHHPPCGRRRSRRGHLRRPGRYRKAHAGGGRRSRRGRLRGPGRRRYTHGC